MITLGEWRRGFSFTPEERDDLMMYIWFYEWNMFEAVHAGQHTGGDHVPQKTLNNNAGVLEHPELGLRLEVAGTEEGADLQLSVTNKTDRTWPEIAAIIPCFNPGKQPEVSETETFLDKEQERTWFLAEEGLVPLIHRDIHFNHDLRNAIDAETTDGKYVWHGKWPTSQTNATGGILMRESTDKTWVAAIAWDNFLSVQGHNPWFCMHQSIRVGPLAPGETSTTRGRIYLFEGTRHDCIEKFKTDFCH